VVIVTEVSIIPEQSKAIGIGTRVRKIVWEFSDLLMVFDVTRILASHRQAYSLRDAVGPIV
jgi:hypothetical protein